MPTQPATQMSAETIVTLEEMIKSSLANLDNLKVELKKEREMLESACESDVIWRETAEKAKEAAKVKMTAKKAINQNPAVLKISDKTKFLRNEIKERQQLLSDYVIEYQKMTGVNEIKDIAGETLEIVSSVRLVRKKKNKS
jgi:hypothetical protein